MQGKGKQFVPHGLVVEMALPGGAGYGKPSNRDAESVKRDIALGYITAEHAVEHYDVSAAEVDTIIAQSKLGDS